jgi:hypothetical protein
VKGKEKQVEVKVEEQERQNAEFRRKGLGLLLPAGRQGMGNLDLGSIKAGIRCRELGVSNKHLTPVFLSCLMFFSVFSVSLWLIVLIRANMR